MNDPCVPERTQKSMHDSLRYEANGRNGVRRKETAHLDPLSRRHDSGDFPPFFYLFSVCTEYTHPRTFSASRQQCLRAVSCPPMRAATPFALFLAVGHLSPALAQDLEPRNYQNAPIRLNFLVAGYGFSEGSVLFDPAVALDNAELEIHGPLVGYARILEIAGQSAKADAAIGRVCLDGSADFQGQRVARSVCGTTDAKLRLAVNFLGAPALPAAEFATYRQDLIAGASFMVSAPVGQYDPSRLVNIGTNRWSARAEIGMSKLLGRWILELALAGNWFEDNDEFFGGNTRSQEEIWSLQGHLVRGFASGIWFALDATHYEGGKTTMNGIPSNDLQSNSRFGATVSVPINRRQSLKFGASSGVATRTGTDFDLYALAWQYRWGGGI